MECACDLGVDDVVTMIKDTTPKARKEHVCGECGEIIKPGDKYERHDTVYEGEFKTYKTCLPCSEVRGKYLRYGWFYNNVWSDLRDCFGDVPLSDFEKFSPAAQQKILEKL